jgi:hypothetical protein
MYIYIFKKGETYENFHSLVNQAWTNKNKCTTMHDLHAKMSSLSSDITG